MLPTAAPIQEVRNSLTLVRKAHLRPLALTVVLIPLVTLPIASSGLDATVNLLAQGMMPLWATILWSAPPMILGMIAPFLIPVMASFVPSLRPLAPQLWASFLLSLALVSLLKALTGRVHPEAAIPADLFERSTTLVLFSGNMFEGWPSGHAATNGAVALTLARLATQPLVQGIGQIWALWVWAAVVLGINGQVHWLSDMLAGALLALGVTFSLFPKESWP